MVKRKETVSLGTFARVGVWALFALWALVWCAPSPRIEDIAVASWVAVASIETVVLIIQHRRLERED